MFINILKIQFFIFATVMLSFVNINCIIQIYPETISEIQEISLIEAFMSGKFEVYKDVCPNNNHIIFGCYYKSSLNHSINYSIKIIDLLVVFENCLKNQKELIQKGRISIVHLMLRNVHKEYQKQYLHKLTYIDKKQLQNLRLYIFFEYLDIEKYLKEHVIPKLPKEAEKFLTSFYLKDLIKDLKELGYEDETLNKLDIVETNRANLKKGFLENNPDLINVSKNNLNIRFYSLNDEINYMIAEVLQDRLPHSELIEKTIKK